jgi:hypothetical protein
VGDHGPFDGVPVPAFTWRDGENHKSLDIDNSVEPGTSSVFEMKLALVTIEPALFFRDIRFDVEEQKEAAEN